ncbi:hypothetical protein OKA04_06935 [Luteolibacter flavescens]|uniref:Uncharacterized protein n=1 Tax=Luteolibacter flavescens TaxID=1859460 RepID=A0ABT3FLL5_9BACT|nr:hypothetical protein [Luteolibacter flavescens]MCW1884460.1 hypothetical protein [Luteolibacter flavescens]
MKPIPFLRTLTFATGLLFASGPAFAQMAEGLDSGDLAPAPPAGQAPSPATTKPNSPAAAAAAAEIEPSRYAGEEVPAYVRQLAARFSIRKRATDPFGRYQDPDHVAPEPKIQKASPAQRFRPEPPMPFSEIIAGISINTVIPAKQQFLIGNRMFAVGDTVTLRLPNGKELAVKVVSVNASRIRFLNASSNETADLVLNMLPPGMQKGGAGKINAPGVEPNDSDAPIDVEPTNPLSTNH